MSEAGIEKYKYPAEAVVCHTGCPLIDPFTNTPSQHEFGLSCVVLGGDDVPEEPVEPVEPVEPDEPVELVEPDEPDEPDEPVEPDEPDDAVEPDDEPALELLSLLPPPQADNTTQRAASSSSLAGLAS